MLVQTLNANGLFEPIGMIDRFREPYSMPAYRSAMIDEATGNAQVLVDVATLVSRSPTIEELASNAHAVRMMRPRYFELEREHTGNVMNQLGMYLDARIEYGPLIQRLQDYGIAVRVHDDAALTDRQMPIYDTGDGKLLTAPDVVLKRVRTRDIEFPPEIKLFMSHYDGLIPVRSPDDTEIAKLLGSIGLVDYHEGIPYASRNMQPRWPTIFSNDKQIQQFWDMLKESIHGHGYF